MEDFIDMPEEINLYNGRWERCDIAQGPCCCGAWHRILDWPEDIQEQIKEKLKNQLQKL